MNFTVFVTVVWLTAKGFIAGHEVGVAVDVQTCERLAEQSIAEHQNDPELKGLTPKFSCWDTRASKTPPAPQAPSKKPPVSEL